MTTSASLPAAAVPLPVREVLDRLARAGHPSALVGGCVRDLLEGHPVRDFDVATPAPVQVVLEIFPRAVPTGLRHGTVMVPTPAGPVDITTFRAGPRLEDDLARRDFTLNALAWRADEERVLDPHGGRADLAAGQLRAVGSAVGRLDEDPLRALRGARLVAERGLEPDAALVAAMKQAAPRLAGVAAERLRQETERLLVGVHAGAALRLLRVTGIEATLAPGCPERGPEIVDALPRRRDVRLAGWLLGTRAARILSRLRFPHRVVERVDRWHREHPVHERTDPARGAAVRRLLHRLEPGDWEVLCELAVVAGRRGEEPAEDTPRRLAALREAVDRTRSTEKLALRRADLAIDGREAMEVLGCGPGPEVGEALAFLTECVLEDPDLNTPEALRERLATWRQRRRTGAR